MISRHYYFDKAHAFFWPLLLLVGNLIVVFGADLAYDEAYYWLFSRHLDWGYFDHPPMAALFIALTSWIPGEIGVRLTFVLATQGITWLCANTVEQNKKWMVWAGFSIFPLLAFSGVFALPDGPLVVFSAVWLWSLKRSLENDSWGNALLVGLVSALLLYSKYHGVLYLVGTLIALPHLLKRPTFWSAAVVGLILFFPHIYWQWSHGFPTIHYHFIDRPKVAFGIKSPIELILSQLVLQGGLLGPVLWWGLFKKKSSNEFNRVLKTIAIFIPIFFLISSFNKKVEANWAVAAGIPLLLFVIRERAVDFQKIWSRRLFISSLIIVFIGRLIMVVPPSWHSLKRGGEFHGWRKWAQDMDNKTNGECSLVANRYQIASKLSFYLNREVTALNVGSRLNQFEFWDIEKSLMDRPVCWITQVRIFPGEEISTPDGKNLVLVKGIPLSDILSHKEKSL